VVVINVRIRRIDMRSRRRALVKLASATRACVALLSRNARERISVDSVSPSPMLFLSTERANGATALP